MKDLVLILVPPLCDFGGDRISLNLNFLIYKMIIIVKNGVGVCVPYCPFVIKSLTICSKMNL